MHGHNAPRSSGSRTPTVAIIIALVVQVIVVLFILYRPSTARDRVISESPGGTFSIKRETERRLANMAALAKQISAIPSPAAPPPPPPVTQNAQGKKKKAEKPVDPWLTRETCHILNDDTELCQYDGPICVSQSDTAEFVFVSSPPADHGQADDRSWCYDARTFETSHACRYQGSRRRENLPAHAYAQPVHFAQSHKPVSTAGGRVVGPEQRRMPMIRMRKDALVRASSAEAISQLGPEWVEFAATSGALPGDPETKPLPEAGTKMESALGWADIRAPVSIKWLDGPMYITNLMGQWEAHPWHFAAAVFQMFAAKLENSTEPEAGESRGRRLNPGATSFALGGDLHLPPMDYWAVIGPYLNRNAKSLDQFGSWNRGVWPLLTQQHTKTLFNGVLTDEYGVSPTSFVCAKSGVVTGLKPRLFSGTGDAQAFRLAAYALANVTSPAFDTHAPPKITLLARHGSRGFADTAAIENMVKATGLPYEMVGDMGYRTWRQQVELMAGTGILIASHGAALVNAMYLPAHAAVIEIFPYLLHFTMYKELAEAANLFYYRVRTERPSKEMNVPGFEVFDDQPFQKECEETHVPSMDAGLLGPCNWRSKSVPVYPDLKVLQYYLDMALDDIGCRDGICHSINSNGQDVFTDFKSKAGK